MCDMCGVADLRRHAAGVYKRHRHHRGSKGEGEGEGDNITADNTAKGTAAGDPGCPYVLGVVYVKDDQLGCDLAGSTGKAGDGGSTSPLSHKQCPKACTRSAVERFARSNYAQARLHRIHKSLNRIDEIGDNGTSGKAGCPYVLGVVYVNDDAFACDNGKATTSTGSTGSVAGFRQVRGPVAQEDGITEAAERSPYAEATAQMGKTYTLSAAVTKIRHHPQQKASAKARAASEAASENSLAQVTAHAAGATCPRVTEVTYVRMDCMH